MAYVLALRKGKSRRTKKKILLKNGGGLLEGSTVATQWPTLPCLPFTRVLKTDSSKNTASQSTSGLQTWLDSFPGKVKQSEKIIFKKIDQAWQRKDIDEMFQLIKENEFSDETQKKALHYWDQGHYYQEGEKRNKALTPLARFRIRERFLPPKNICPNGRKKATLPREATAKLRAWLDENPRPYPTRETKAALADDTGLTILQVNTWFANTRRRMRGKSKTQRKDEVKSKHLWNRSSLPEPWQVPILTTTMASTPGTVPPCASFCTCPPHATQIHVPTSLGSNVSDYWTEMTCNAGTLTDWPGSYTGTVGNQYLAPPVVALTPNLWEPEFQCRGLHAAAQILMDMASK